MPIQYNQGEVVFDGRCEVEEADVLLEWLRRTPEPRACLGTCTDLHTALAQLLIVAKFRIAVRPADPLLAACLGAAASVRTASAGVSQGAAAKPPGAPKLKRKTAR
jgi:hypothetical protein